MIGVLEEVLGEHPVAGGIGITSQLQVTLVNHGRRTAHFAFWAVAFHGPIWLVAMIVVVMSTATATAPAGLAAATTLTFHRISTVHVTIRKARRKLPPALLVAGSSGLFASLGACARSLVRTSC